MLRVVAVFGKYEDGATTSSDAGHQRLQPLCLNRAIADELAAARPTDPSRGPVQARCRHTPRSGLDATLADGKRRAGHVDALLVDNVRTARRGVQRPLRRADSATADLIIYNGHAGLGANIRALAQEGRLAAGPVRKMVFMNGCDTYAYVDDALARSAHGRHQPRRSHGHQVPGHRHQRRCPRSSARCPAATMALVRGLLDASTTRKTYEQMFVEHRLRLRSSWSPASTTTCTCPAVAAATAVTPDDWVCPRQEPFAGDGPPATDENRFETPVLRRRHATSSC